MEQRDPHAELHALCSDLGEVESELALLQAQREQLRNQISVAVAELGGKAKVDGFGSMQITSATTVVSYDRTKLDALITALRASGQGEVADAIADARKETERAGSLMIKRS